MNVADIFAGMEEVPKPEIKEICQKVYTYGVNQCEYIRYFHRSWILPVLNTVRNWQWNTVNCGKTVVLLNLSIASA